MRVLTAFIESLRWGVRASGYGADALLVDGPSVPRASIPASLRACLPPVFERESASNQAFALFAALRRDDLDEARRLAFRLQRAAKWQGLTATNTAAAKLEIALVFGDTCEESPIRDASAELVAAMSTDGILLTVAP